MNDVEILLVEDNPDDVELALFALRKNNFGEKTRVVRDGAEALDFLFCRNAYASRSFDKSNGIGSRRTESRL